VRDGAIPLSRLQEAYARVRGLRERLVERVPFTDAVDEDAPLEAARRAPTPLRGESKLHAGKPVTVISFEGAVADNAALSGRNTSLDSASLSAALRRRGCKSEIMRVAIDPPCGDVDLLLEHVAALGDREFVLVTRDAHVHDGQRAAVARILAQAPDALIVSARAPYDALLWPLARRVLCIYGDQPISIDGCADVLAGRVEPRGLLPIRLTEDAAVH